MVWTAMLWDSILFEAHLILKLREKYAEVKRRKFIQLSPPKKKFLYLHSIFISEEIL